MSDLQPQLWLSLQDYSKEKFMKDLTAGIIVAIIALPLSIALALASGVGPQEGLYTAIIAGLLIAAFGGSKVQISGPTAAFATIVAGIVATYGTAGLMIATVMAGIILLLMGILRMGSLIKFIPYTITCGFTAGIALTIIIGQIKDFSGMTFSSSPVDTISKCHALIEAIPTFSVESFCIGALALFILIVSKRFLKMIPGSLIAVIVTSILVYALHLPVYTIGDLYTISSQLPTLHIPTVSYTTVIELIPSAFTIAVLAAIESLLSAVVADEMTESRHNSNMELIGQGIGNIGSALFGGIPATGAIARTAANIKSGGVTPMSSIIHSLILLFTLVLFMPYASLIPMPCIAAILFQVAYNMSGWRVVLHIIKRAPYSDVIVLVLTFFLTVFFNLVVAITVGIILASLLLMKRLADVTSVREWHYIDNIHDDPTHPSHNNKRLKPVPNHVMVYEFVGPMFFGATDKIPHFSKTENKSVLIIRMRAVPSMDISAIRGLEQLYDECKYHDVQIVFSHVNEQPLSIMKKAGLYGLIGPENFQPNIDEAIKRAVAIRDTLSA